jgi:glycosyltransferase involved in cell wall biosynthesis
MRFVLVSTHTDQTTGYSKVAHNLLKQLSTLSPKVKIFHFGFQRHPNKPNHRKVPDGIVQYDAAANEDPKEEGFGFNKIYDYLDMVNPDVVMIYNDPLIIYRFIEAMKHERGKSSYKLWIYVDQVYEGIAQPLIDKINEHADRVYCFTDIWKQKYLSYGLHTDVRILEHAVDSATFSTLSAKASNQVRRNMNIPDDAIIFLNANRNSQRKRLDLSISGFVEYLSRSPEKKVYMIIATNVNPQSGAYYDVLRIYQMELQHRNLPFDLYMNRLMIVDTAPPNVLGDDGINQLYNAADVGINTTDGEGFGLCQLEHMFTGAPQIVTDVGSFRTFLNTDVAEFIPCGDRTYQAGSMPLGFYSPTFSVASIADAMDRMISTLNEKRIAARNYKFKTWSQVCDEWLEDVLTESSK